MLLVFKKDEHYNHSCERFRNSINIFDASQLTCF